MSQKKVATQSNIHAITQWSDYIDLKSQITGDPNCKIHVVRTKGATTPLHQAMLLTLEPSEFNYRFEHDESWIVMQGKATITLEDGEVIHMQKGDMVSVLGGRNSTWLVTEPFQKFVVITSG